MAIENFKIGSRKDDIRLLKIIVFLFVIAVWLVTPPGNKFIQVCFWGHNVQYAITRIKDKNVTEEYKFYWNNAIYLTQLGDQKALTEMDKAIILMPPYFTETQSQTMYKERAKMRCVFKDYKGALDDYLKVKNLNNDDILRIALLLKTQKKNSLALSYCNKLLFIELGLPNACACVADVYASVGKFNSSIKVYDYLIKREPDVAEHYLARAKYKKIVGDNIGARNDIYLAQLKDASVDLELAPITDVLLLKNIKFERVI